MTESTKTQQQPTTDQTEEPKPVAEMTAAEVAMEGCKLATSYLEKRGYSILEREWRCQAGEVDAVAEDEGTPVLVLVKTARKLGEDSEAMPELAIDKAKQARCRKLALLWLAGHPEAESVRVDVIALNIVGERCARLRHLIGAYQWEE
jgi:putative endonuclease